MKQIFKITFSAVPPGWQNIAEQNQQHGVVVLEAFHRGPVNVPPWRDPAFYHNPSCAINGNNCGFISRFNVKCMLKCSSIAVTKLKMCCEKYKITLGHNSMCWIGRNPQSQLYHRRKKTWFHLFTEQCSAHYSMRNVYFNTAVLPWQIWNCVVRNAKRLLATNPCCQLAEIQWINRVCNAHCAWVDK